MTVVYLLIEQELPRHNHGYVHRVFSTREHAERCLNE